MGTCGSKDIGLDAHATDEGAAAGGGGGGNIPASVDNQRRSSKLPFGFAGAKTGTPWDAFSCDVDGASSPTDKRPHSKDVLVQVFNVVEKDTGAPFTARQTFTSSAVKAPAIKQQLDAILGLSHPLLAQPRHAFINACSVYLITDTTPGGIPLPEYVFVFLLTPHHHHHQHRQRQQRQLTAATTTTTTTATATTQVRASGVD
jgi:hypothetical protein